MLFLALVVRGKRWKEKNCAKKQELILVVILSIHPISSSSHQATHLNDDSLEVCEPVWTCKLVSPHPSL
jgi:hypothetical protein